MKAAVKSLSQARQIRQVFGPVVDRLEQVETFFSREFSAAEPLVRDVATYVLGSGGKRLRPMLTIATAKMTGFQLTADPANGYPTPPDYYMLKINALPYCYPAMLSYEEPGTGTIATWTPDDTPAIGSGVGIKMSAGGDALAYGTFLGGSRGDKAKAIAVDDAGLSNGKYAYRFWISDNTAFPATIHQHIGGANRWLPSHLLNMEAVKYPLFPRNVRPYDQVGDETFSDFWLATLMGGLFGLGGNGRCQRAFPDILVGLVNLVFTIAALFLIDWAIPRQPGDFNFDGDVDQEDFGWFQACITGAGVAQNDPACLDARFDDDEDVDQDDFGRGRSWQTSIRARSCRRCTTG